MRNRISIRGLVAGLAVAAAIPTAALALTAAPVSASASAVSAPAPCSTPAVVKSAELVRTVNGPMIQVTGLKPQADAKLTLDADNIAFVVQPDYFPYTVHACNGTGPVVKTPFTQLFEVPTNPVGKFGIEVNGIQLDLFPHTMAAA